MKNKPNFIICASADGIGGMEVLFANYVRYLIDKGYNVFLITQKIPNNIYLSLLEDIRDKYKVIYRYTDNILYMSESQRESQRKEVLSQIGNIEYSNSYGISGFFYDVLTLSSIFVDKEIRLSLFWPHPMDWAFRIPLIREDYYFKKNYKSRLYQYQRKLLMTLDDNHASYYTSYAIFDFNQWYYDVNLPERKIEGLPIQKNSGTDFIYHVNQDIKEWNILWVGRFDFFKIDAIDKIYNTLIKLHNDKCCKFNFNLVGYGPQKFEKKIKARLKGSDGVKVNFLGVKKPDELNNVFMSNHIGFAMGVTVKQMGYAGLPAILVDSLSGDYQTEKCCNWVSDIATGDDGDGIYYEKMGAPLNYRRGIYDILAEVIDNPLLLNSISINCMSHITADYGYDRQYDIMTQHAMSSSFTGNKADIYRYPFLRRFLRYIKIHITKIS